MKKSVLQNPLHNDKAFDIFVICIISLTLVALLYPLYFIVIASISEDRRIRRFGDERKSNAVRSPSGSRKSEYA